MRLGFAVKVLGRPLKEADLRRAASRPSLSKSLEYLGAVFDYLVEAGLPMYRMSSDMARYMTHPEYPDFHGQLPVNEKTLVALGRFATRHAVRLSFHPGQYILLNSTDEDVVARSLADLDWQAQILDIMDLSPEAVVVLHIGGAYGEPQSAKERFVRNFEAAPEHVRRRLVIENDDVSYSVADCLWVRERTGLRIVFDNLHHAAVNPEGMPEREALAACLDSWPAEQRPKIHFASPRTAFTEAPPRKKGHSEAPMTKRIPKWTSHADFADPFAFVRLLAQAPDRDFDVMLEAKAKDLAVFALRDFLRARGVAPKGDGRMGKLSG
jgi:UV DNA damage endonuclease